MSYTERKMLEGRINNKKFGKNKLHRKMARKSRRINKV